MELVETEEHQYDFRVEEFYLAPAVKGEDESVAESVYASSGKYIDPVSCFSGQETTPTTIYDL